MFDNCFSWLVDWDVEDQQNGLCKVPICTFSFCGVQPKRKLMNQNQEYMMNWNNKFETL